MPHKRNKFKKMIPISTPNIRVWYQYICIMYTTQKAIVYLYIFDQLIKQLRKVCAWCPSDGKLLHCLIICKIQQHPKQPMFHWNGIRISKSEVNNSHLHLDSLVGPSIETNVARLRRQYFRVVNSTLSPTGDSNDVIQGVTMTMCLIWWQVDGQ